MYLEIWAAVITQLTVTDRGFHRGSDGALKHPEREKHRNKEELPA